MNLTQTHKSDIDKCQLQQDEKLDGNDEPINQDKYVSEFVSIKINEKSKAYDILVLKQLPYFEARLSDRWNTNNESGNRNCKVTTSLDIDVDTKLDSTDSHNIESKSDVTTINVGDDMSFTLDIFETLINIPQTMSIDSHFPVNSLESLLHCESFFLLDVIDQDMVNRYLELSNDFAYSKLKSTCIVQNCSELVTRLVCLFGFLLVVMLLVLVYIVLICLG